MTDAANPTTRSGLPPTTAPATFRVEIVYSPQDGSLAFSGNVVDPLLFYGMLALAEKAFDQRLARQQAEAAMKSLATPRSGPRIVTPA